LTKLIIFDLDGVLCDCKDLHFLALNEALRFCGFREITRQEHIGTFDGLNTRAKLDKLGIYESAADNVFEYKQKFTNNLIANTIEPNATLRRELVMLYKSGYTLVVASNSIRHTIVSILDRVGIKYLFSGIYSNEDVKHPKPHPEMYMKAMMDYGVSPKETLIVEDSHIGRMGAHASGAHVCPVKNCSEVTALHIMNPFFMKKKDHKWNPGKLNVLIPMAGEGSRFAKAGYTFPKPLIEVRGEPMIKVVVDNLNVEANFIFIVRKWQYEKYNLQTMLNLIAPGCTIIQIDSLTEGAACTALLAREAIDNDTPLLIANSDQFVEFSSAEFMYSMTDNVDGGLITFENTHPKWSYVKKDENGYCTQVVEKNPISNEATVGIYYWSKGSDFVKYADRMIWANDRYNNEFYIAPVYQHAINDGKKIKTFKVKQMWGLGTPEDLDNYLKFKK
jgi:HAD superfamily hydrolase (TIGR01509 family)